MNGTRKTILALATTCLIGVGHTFAQGDVKTMRTALADYLDNYNKNATCYTSLDKVKVEDISISSEERTVYIYLNEGFLGQPFTPESVNSIQENIRQRLPRNLQEYKLVVYADGTPIEMLIPVNLTDGKDTSRVYGKKEYKGHPWVQREEMPYSITHGLQGRHLCLWASHGKYYNNKAQKWIWQRPRLFCTTEDLFTQTIVVPYLIPMLENAGACVFTPRDRDWQKNEAIVDNDAPESGGLYQETNGKYTWNEGGTGFAYRQAFYQDGDTPFADGTCRIIESATGRKEPSTALWRPLIPEEGDYAVYVSYRTFPNSVDDAKYIVRHQGIDTPFTVNQQMGGGTWVYLGTFHFDAGDLNNNCVILTNQSSSRGVVSADAVRFGGGMSNIVRSDSTMSYALASGLPRFLEAARYSAPWYGFPLETYCVKDNDDYGDDINVRSRTENYLGRGSVYLPGDSGLCVPIELSMGIHSDAGFRKDSSIVGTLGIYTADFYEGITGAGLSRLTSRDLADIVMTQMYQDLTRSFGQWTRRQMYNRNYGESREPQYPAIILEMMSHQNWSDMRMGHDPYFKFTMARAIYKGILRYLAAVHICDAVVQPLPVNSISSLLDIRKKKARISWQPTVDILEETAQPSKYILYISRGGAGYDNGTAVDARSTAVDVDLEPDVMYRFRITAANSGGESIPSEEVCCYLASEDAPHILMVDGFQRVAGPKAFNTENNSGFDMSDEPGVVDKKSPCYCGYQLYFGKDGCGKENSTGHGYSGSELEGMIMAGNTHDWSCVHAREILKCGQYNISSCVASACPMVDVRQIDMADIIFGAQMVDGYSMRPYKTFTTEVRNLVEQLTQNGKGVMVSGAHMGTDMAQAEEQQFLKHTLKWTSDNDVHAEEGMNVQGMNTTASIYTEPNETHYWVRRMDVLQPTAPAFTTMLYDGGEQASAVAYQGNDYKAISYGFPLECIISPEARSAIFAASVQFLLGK
ncbi:MAG: hypothetical protein ACI4B5_01925 [Bacteroidaceae bacterium]